MNAAIEIHDSSVTSITARGSLVEVCLRAYVHKSHGTPGLDAGTGSIENVTLAFEDGSIDGMITQYPITLSDGTLKIDGESSENSIPIPLSRTGSIELRLQVVDSGPVTIRGGHVDLQVHGTPTEVEDFPGSTT